MVVRCLNIKLFLTEVNLSDLKQRVKIVFSIKFFYMITVSVGMIVLQNKIYIFNLKTSLN